MGPGLGPAPFRGLPSPHPLQLCLSGADWPLIDPDTWVWEVLSQPAGGCPFLWEHCVPELVSKLDVNKQPHFLLSSCHSPGKCHILKRPPSPICPCPHSPLPAARVGDRVGAESQCLRAHGELP